MKYLQNFFFPKGAYTLKMLIITMTLLSVLNLVRYLLTEDNSELRPAERVGMFHLVVVSVTHIALVFTLGFATLRSSRRIYATAFQVYLIAVIGLNLARIWATPVESYPSPVGAIWLFSYAYAFICVYYWKRKHTDKSVNGNQ